MVRKYLITSFHIDCTNAAGGATVQYVLVFTERGEMLVEESRTYNHPFNNDTLLEIHPEQFENHTIAGVPLRQLVIKKLEEILPEPN